jgi:CheY-like chemotaxis protein
MELKRILIVEDDPHDLELTLLALDECHLANEVDVVRDGAEALEYLFHQGSYADRPNLNPAIVLLDFKLPKVDGADVLKAIRENSETRMIPVVVFTSSREERDWARSYQLGANSYVVKPLDFDQFLSSIKQIGVFWALTNEPPPGSARKVG